MAEEKFQKAACEQLKALLYYFWMACGKWHTVNGWMSEKKFQPLAVNSAKTDMEKFRMERVIWQEANKLFMFCLSLWQTESLSPKCIAVMQNSCVKFFLLGRLSCQEKVHWIHLCQKGNLKPECRLLFSRILCFLFSFTCQIMIKLFWTSCYQF